VRRAYEQVDWAATPLGSPGTWSPALCNAVDLALHTRFPVTLFWGPEFVLVYNEAYAGLIADKHPAALGAPAADVFPEAWARIGPMMQSVRAGKGATWVEDERMPLWRNGRLEECFFTFSYSPVRGADGAIEGVMDIATETTRQVVDRRRLELLAELGAALSDVGDPAEVAKRALPLLRAAADDLPSVEIRLGEQRARRAVVVEETADGSVASLPLVSRTSAGGTLVVGLSEHLAPDGAYLGFLRLVADLLGQALDRVGERAAERSMSEALQLSLLARPPSAPGVEIAVRYRPAAEQAQVGGDWYDAFELDDGTLTVVVGDVTGHDVDSAVAMAQVRTLLRGVGVTLQASPAAVLMGLDRAMAGLGVDVFATAILAHVGVPGRDGARSMTWCNAGHLPPVVVAPDGRARLLEAPPDVLLGVAAADRADRATTLEAGSAMVIYTDGLVERRGVALTESLRWIRGVLDGLQLRSAEELADHVVAQLDGGVEDDVAVLVLRV
jgi:hypothetical protein